MSVISQFSSGGVKSVQSGIATVAGTTTITSVNTAKSVVTSVSKGSSVTNTTLNGAVSISPLAQFNYQNGSLNVNTGAVSLNRWESANYGGTTDSKYPTAVTANMFSARLTNATTITVDGPCEWQVVEYY